MTLLPTNEAQAIEAVRGALSEKTPLRVSGGGTRAGLGRPVQAGRDLSARALCGITLYEPSEMVVGAKAGTPLAEIEARLAEKGQRLPFEPMDHRALFASQGEPTIGAIAAGNISGPRRLYAGAARDALIGVRFVNGRGEAIKSGGRVMKNVTGLDLVKFQAGAQGTLGFLTEVIFRVVPVAQTQGAVVLEGLSEAQAIKAMAAAVGSPYEVTGAAHVPGETPRTWLRIEGFADSVAYRLRALKHMLGAFGAARVVEAEETAAAFAGIRDAVPLAQPSDAAIWRLSLKPSLAAEAVRQVRASREVRALYDWGGGLVWLATAAEENAGAAAIRAAAKAAKGHATLVRASDALRLAVPVFTPEAPALAALTKRIKRSVDPEGLFNPGLMFEGM